MPVTVERTTGLDCTADQAWAQVQTSALLQHIAAPLIRFIARGEPFPKVWTEGEYRAWMLLFGVLPIGWQAVVISFPEAEGTSRFVRDNGYGPLIRRWDHWIEIAPDPAHPDKAIYTDRVTIDAGVLTPVVAAFARLFYAHRQGRWRALAADGFARLRG